MKKKIFILLVGLMLIGVNVFAAGDLIVNGQVGIGTSTPAAKLDLQTDSHGLNVDINQTTALDVKAADYLINIDGSTQVFGTTGFKSLIKYIGTSSPLPATRGALMTFQFRSTSAGSSTFSFIRGLDLEVRDMSDNARDYTGDELSMFRTGGSFTGLGTTTVTDVAGARIDDLDNSSGKLVATNVFGMLIEKQTAGTSNFGVVLNGEGAGSDIVFGAHTNSVRPRIYSDAGQIYADDALGSHSLISPHDPVTGEWIFYSKNLRTGKVVKVNMEKLVKAVEKITGETFMVETIEEIK